MKLRARFTLVILGVLVFLVATPILVIYARGFQIDWKTGHLTKTGALVVKTEPTKATVYLNDKAVAEQTPTNVRFLLPGDYNVRIEKDDYQSWTKRLSVKSQFVTWANADRDFVTLFLKDAKLSQTYNSQTASISRLGDEIVFLDNDQLRLLNTNNSSTSTLGTSADIKLPALSVQTLKYQNASSVFSLLKNNSWNFSTSQVAKINHVELNDQHAVADIGGSLYFLESNDLKLIDKDIVTFTLADDGVWYIQKSFLKHYIFSKQSSETINTTLPTSTNAEIIRTNNQIYLILDKTLYLVNGTVEKIYAPVTAAFWDTKSLSLLYSNDNEIYRYHTDTKNSDLILRNLTPIKNPVINFETGYIFYQNEGKIKAIEIDARDHHNVYNIADALDSFAVATDGKTLFVLGANQIKQYTIR